MLYVLNPTESDGSYLYGLPSGRYFRTIMDGYLAAGFDTRVLYAAADASKKTAADFSKKVKKESKKRATVSDKKQTKSFKKTGSISNDATIPNKVKEQILAIRDTGRTNMLDLRQVQALADSYGYYELVTFIEDHKKKYWEFIINGEA